MFIFTSSIGRKFIQAVSGAFLIIFLLLHATINFFSVIDSFNGSYGHVAADESLFSAVSEVLQRQQSGRIGLPAFLQVLR